ncbi:hypothetical protein [Companilactobacillus insicii]|uniref:hypothetical protein n=1 Tax=Companilactobacillus insicii TaxID=1732567 RepID=UPI000F78FE5F|nr:hypothetical protein [Companilactobacillus insicii]
MKYKKYLLLSISALSILVVTGCGNGSNDSSSSSTPNKETAVKDVVIKGHNFKGTHKGDGTAKNPNYKYSMYFGKDGNFVQDIISSNGLSGRFTERGTYTIAKNGDVTMKIASVTEERFASDQDLSNGNAPISIFQREGHTLNAAEDHDIKIKNKKTYLLGTVNNVKLYQTDKQTVDYRKHYKSEMSKYNNSYGKFSNHGFTSNGMDTPMNAIAFKGSNFIWRYGYQDENKDSDSAVMAVFEGTYSYDSSNHIMTLDITNQSNAYYGNLMSLGGFEYKKSGSPLAGKTLKLKYHDNTLTLVTGSFKCWNMEDGYPNDASQSQPKYDDYVNSYAVSTFDSQMHKTSENSNSTFGLNSAEDFKQFMIDEGFFGGMEDNWEPIDKNHEGRKYNVTYSNDTEANDPDEVSAIYTLYYVTGPASQVLILGDDGTIYSGNPTGVLRAVDDATDDLIQKAANGN